MISDQQVKRPLEQIGQEYAALCSQLGDTKHMIHEHELTVAELHARLTMLKHEFKEAEELAKTKPSVVPPDAFVDEAHPFVADVAP
jgi:hypothetical protein